MKTIFPSKVVFDALKRQARPVSRARLVELTGLSGKSVSYAVAVLIKSGLIARVAFNRYRAIDFKPMRDSRKMIVFSAVLAGKTTPVEIFNYLSPCEHWLKKRDGTFNTSILNGNLLKLMADGLIFKQKRGVYALTEKGKDYANTKKRKATSGAGGD